MSEWHQHPEVKAWLRKMRANLVPMIRDSAVSVSIVPSGEPDVKFSVELGLSIMLDKPIIAVVTPGAKVPSKLVKVADEIIEGDLHTEEGRARLADRRARPRWEAEQVADVEVQAQARRSSRRCRPTASR